MVLSSVDQSNKVYLLPLADDGSPDVPGGYIYLPPPSEPPYMVRFLVEGTSSICREGSFWTNIPAENDEFVREKFREYKLHPDFSRNIEISIPIRSAGAFAFYTTYTPLPDFSHESVSTPKPTRTPTYYLDVCPRLTLQNELLPLDAISLISVISKCMGKYPEDWNKILDGIGRLSYNMVHFLPLMHRGISNSPYSIYDQFTFDPQYFPNGESDVASLVKRMETEYGLLSLIDVVWNHTANNSAWLQEHPEAGYNLLTAPWMQSAVELEDALLKFSSDLERLGLPTELKTTEDLEKVIARLKPDVFSAIKLWEYYVVNVERDVRGAVDTWLSRRAASPRDEGNSQITVGLRGVENWPLEKQAAYLRDNALRGNDRMGERFRRHIDPDSAATLIDALFGHQHQSADRESVTKAFTKIADELNLPFYKEYNEDCAVIMKQVSDRVRYLRLDDNGPKRGPVTKDSPLIERYFTRLPLNSTTRKHEPGSLALANNGWVWNADAMKDHAGPTSKVYLRRELIVWGDCVKLRYGANRDANPYLWDRMAGYTRLMAKHFNGFRIDNCHSTPIYVAEHLLDEARRVRPNLFVCGELFTGSEEMDYIFVKRLGMSSLIREAMQAWSTGELSRLVHMHGGRPIGSFDVDRTAGLDPFTPLGRDLDESLASGQGYTYHRIKRTPVHALFMDCTHDNEVPAQKRDARDTLPNAALVYMCACATGSVMGYDDIYPRIVDLVNETRTYMIPEADGGNTESLGIRHAKKILSDIHTLMGKAGYDETYIHHEGEYITVHRMHPISRDGYFLVAHTAFPGFGDGHGTLNPARLNGTKAKLLGSWSLEVDVSEKAVSDVLKDKHILKGLPSSLKAFDKISIDQKDNETVISVPKEFRPGSIALFKTGIPAAQQSTALDTFVTSGAGPAYDGVNLIDLNFALYRCEAEEKDLSQGQHGVYNVPNFGPLVYAGLQGWWSVLKEIIRKNDLGHPLCRHLREGLWAFDYIVARMERLSDEWCGGRLHRPARWLKERFDAIRTLPNYLLPRYFALVIQSSYNAAFHRGVTLMTTSIRNGPRFVHELAMVSVQQTGFMRSASLFPDKAVPCLAAGLPHFAADWARCWGRDVFIALRGLYLCTGRFDDAKAHILAFASVMKHGMIPNLLGSGKEPRYNARDAVWFFLQGVQDYVRMAPSGSDILQEKVPRRFLPYDDTWFPFDDSRAYSVSSTIEDIIQEALQRHAVGLSFREEKAGPALDMQMKPEGFQIDVKVDWSTGLIFGGNQNNCGTWQDKMGESERAGSKGVPGTPRDGAAIEITGLCYGTLKWLVEMNKAGRYRYSGVDMDAVGKHISFEQWCALIRDNFEKCYYIPLNQADDGLYDVNTEKVRRRGIYKDLYRSGKEHEDYQLRANFPIAMCVAPELFEPAKALHALSVADSVLRGPVGMATLDPADGDYRPYYNNSEDSTDFATAKGRNYHQGPEWLWPTGFFLRALLKFDLRRRHTKEARIETLQQITRRLMACRKALESSPWAGLTELTNKAGALCADSAPTQAWSAGCVLELFHEASQVLLE